MILRLIGAAGLAALSVSAVQALEGEPEQVLAILAHPDDELFFAPALAQATREGAILTLVYATSGDQGPGVTDMERGLELAARREGEAFCAADALDATVTIFLRHGDGTLGVTAHHPESSAQILKQDLAEILSSDSYDRIITWGPDGGYGHADHRMVSALTAQVVQAMGDDRPQLLYSGIRKGSLPPIPEMQSWAETDPALLTVQYPYTGADLAAATRAAACHETQFDEASRAGMMAMFDQSIWQGSVYFRPAFPEPDTE